MTRFKRGALGLLLTIVLLLGAAMALRWGVDRYFASAYPMKYSAIIDKACADKNLDRAFVYALIRTESGFRPDAVSNVGARGLMQMMPDTFDWVQSKRGGEAINFDALFDPQTSVDYGTDMLRLLFDEFETQDNVLCAYHAGWGSAQRWLKNPEYAPDGENITAIPFPDTAHYVDKVSRAIVIYQKLYH